MPAYRELQPILTALSAYIHIPFCSYKCDFCDFTAFAGLDHLADDYGQVVCREIADRLSILPEKRLVSSVFFGGGTPGLIAPAIVGSMLEALKKHCLVAADAEISLETTPHSITAEKASDWLEMGINRISIGVQSLNDRELQAVGRDHTRQQALEGIELVRRAGFTNISADLMYGLPEQTLATWRQSLDELLALGLPHMSAYGLQLSANTPLFSRYPRESPAYPGEEQFVELYTALVELTAAAGLTQYEISNFSRPGWESAHNLSYWSNDEYLAFGVGAHRYFDGVRSSNWRSLKKYMSDWLGSETSEPIDRPTRLKEAIFLGLRTRRGISLAGFEQRYGVALQERFASQIDKLVGGGFVELDDGQMRLSQKGVLVSNLVMSEFM